VNFSDYGCLFESGGSHCHRLFRVCPKLSDETDKCRYEQKPKDGGKEEPIDHAGYEPFL
jgi:hypothetical protein